MQLGQILIYITFAAAVLSGGAFLITAIGKKNLFNLGKNFFYVQIASIAIASAYLWYLFFSHDYSIQYVYEYSSNSLPFFYLLSSFWAGQDGTYLLWLLMSSVFGLIIIKKAKQYTSLSMVFFAIVNIFLLVMLVTISPFRPLGGVVADGAGLNPLLQDPWMVIHPPIIFVAFAMAGVVFAIIMAAMVKKDYSNWLNLTFPLVGTTALTLAMANVLGGYWAYKTLGWGGYWAWDPVENTSFIPWVVSLGLVHGMLIEKRTGALRKTNLLLGAFVFLLTIYGTFLTRSGVLADFSVHSFADLGANAVLMTFILSYTALTIAVFAFTRTPERTGKPMNYDIFSRDFIMMAGMILLVSLGVIVLFWSSLPLITTHLSDNPRAAEPSTYNTFAFPFAIIISLFLTISPFYAAAKRSLAEIKLKVAYSILISLVLSGLVFILNYADLVISVTLFLYLSVLLIYITGCSQRNKLLIAIALGSVGAMVALLLGVRQVGYLFFITAASIAASSQISLLIKTIPRNWETAGGHLSHFGFGLMLLGILSSSVFDTNEQIVISRDATVSAYQYDITYLGMSQDLSFENNEILLSLNNNGHLIDARPHYFYSKRSDGIMKRPHIEKGLFYDLYLSPQEIQELIQSGGLTLKKGESSTVGEYQVKFIEFDMGSHETTGAMSVGAKLEVSLDELTETIIPVAISGAQGMISEAVPLFPGSDFTVEITRIDASSGAIGLSISDLAEVGPPDMLILDVSKKPGINLLWLGTLIIFGGMFISIRLRFKK